MKKVALVSLLLINGLLLAWGAARAESNIAGTLFDCCKGGVGEEFCCYDCCVTPSDCAECRPNG